MDDPRIITAVAYAIIGLSAITLALRIWWTHPINRVFSLGPYVTEAGLKALLRNVRTVFALGCFALASAASRFAYWQAGVVDAKTSHSHFFGAIETAFAWWAAVCVIIAVVRTLRRT